MTHLAEWFQRNRHKLTRHGIWLDGREPGRPDGAAFDTASLRVLLCRLSTYADTLHSITHRMLFWAARQVPEVYVDLAFLPPFPDLKLLQTHRVPWWTASGCKESPSSFDIVAISISVQQEAFNLPACLKHSGLLLSFTERMNDARHPLLVLGGNAAGTTPLIHGPIRHDANDSGLVDVVCLGDGLEWFRNLLRMMMESKSAGETKRDLLQRLAQHLPGTYVPGFYCHEYEQDTLEKITPVFPDIPFPATHRIEPHDIWTSGYDGGYIPFSDQLTEETLLLASGCMFRCRFCQPAWQRGTLSPADPDAFVRTAERLKSRLICSDLNLLATDAGSINGIESIAGRLAPIFPKLSLKSLTISNLIRRPALISLIKHHEKHEFSFGLEGISRRLRAFLGKQASQSDLQEIIRELTASGLRQIKLFFIATGLETDSDWEEWEELLGFLKGIAPQCRWIASFMPLFHSPFTPMQFAEIQIPGPETEAIIRKITSRCRVEWRWSASPLEVDAMNLLCRAGRQATPLITQLSLSGTSYYYNQLPETVCRRLPDLLRQHKMDINRLRCRRDQTSVFPWDDITAGTSRPAVWKVYSEASSALHQKGTSQTASQPGPPIRRIQPLPYSINRPDKPVSHSLGFWVWLTPEQAWHPDITIGRGILRELAVHQPELVRSFQGTLRLERLPQTSGIAFLSAVFRNQPEPFLNPKERANSGVNAIRSGPIVQGIPDPDTLFFWIQLDRPDITALMDLLRSKKIRYQSIRTGEGLWSVIGSHYVRKSGISVIREHADGRVFFCCSRTFPLFLGKKQSDILSGGIAYGIGTYPGQKCPACGNLLYQVIQSIDNVPSGICIFCQKDIRGC